MKNMDNYFENNLTHQYRSNNVVYHRNEYKHYRIPIVRNRFHRFQFVHYMLLNLNVDIHHKYMEIKQFSASMWIPYFHHHNNILDLDHNRIFCYRHKIEECICSFVHIWNVFFRFVCVWDFHHHHVDNRKYYWKADELIYILLNTYIDTLWSDYILLNLNESNDIVADHDII